MKKLDRLFRVFREETRYSERPRGMSRFERALFHLVRYYGETLMGKIADATTQLNALADQMSKIKAEVQALKDASQNIDTPPEFDAALTRLSGLVQNVDDIDPDAPPAA